MPAKSNQPRRRRKLDPPPKPYGVFPLTPHASDKFQKKINKKIHNFGVWAKRVNGMLVPAEDSGWKGTLAEYEAETAIEDVIAERPKTKYGNLFTYHKVRQPVGAREN
jgi:hypothetical protein